MARKKGLGKGLEALFEDNNTAVSASGVELIKISEIEPNKNQPRRDFDQTALEQLADSIREHGIIQPLVLRPLTAGDGNNGDRTDRKFTAGGFKPCRRSAGIPGTDGKI